MKWAAFLLAFAVAVSSGCISIERTDGSKNIIEVDMTVDFGNGTVWNFPGFETTGKTVLEITLEVADEKGFAVETESYPGMGEYVVSIAGVQKEGFFWGLQVNGEMSGEGASSAQLQDGDVFTWELTGLTW